MNWQLQDSYTLKNLEDLKEFCQKLVTQLQGEELILLSGNLGAGKTELVKQCLNALMVKAGSSPSYALMQEYSLPPDHPWKLIQHWDLYRITNEEELESVAFFDALETRVITFIEWPERVPEVWWPAQRKTIWLQIQVQGSERLLFVQTKKS